MDEQQMKLCTNCNREIPEQNFVVHEGYCSRNIRQCRACKIPLPIADMEQHYHDLHALSPCSKCGEIVCGSDLEDHVRDSCSHTLKICNFCEQEFPRRDLPAHLVYCDCRTQRCNGCGVHVMFKHLAKHIQTRHVFIGPEGEERLQTCAVNIGRLSEGNIHTVLGNLLRSSFARHHNIEPVPIPVPRMQQPTRVSTQQPVPVSMQQPIPVPMQQPIPAPMQQPIPVPMQQPTPVPMQQPIPVPIQQPTPVSTTTTPQAPVSPPQLQMEEIHIDGFEDFVRQIRQECNRGQAWRCNSRFRTVGVPEQQILFNHSILRQEDENQNGSNEQPYGTQPTNVNNSEPTPEYREPNEDANQLYDDAQHPDDQLFGNENHVAMMGVMNVPAFTPVPLPFNPLPAHIMPVNYGAPPESFELFPGSPQFDTRPAPHRIFNPAPSRNQTPRPMGPPANASGPPRYFPGRYFENITPGVENNEDKSNDPDDGALNLIQNDEEQTGSPNGTDPRSTQESPLPREGDERALVKYEPEEDQESDELGEEEYHAELMRRRQRHEELLEEYNPDESERSFELGPSSPGFNDRISEIKRNLSILRRNLNQVTVQQDNVYGRSESGRNGVVMIPCEFCDRAVAADLLDGHQEICSTSDPAPPRIPCEFCEDSFPVYEITPHQNVCRNRREDAPVDP